VIAHEPVPKAVEPERQASAELAFSTDLRELVGLLTGFQVVLPC
jgi:hypothetical protein